MNDVDFNTVKNIFLYFVEWQQKNTIELIPNMKYKMKNTNEIFSLKELTEHFYITLISKYLETL